MIEQYLTPGLVVAVGIALWRLIHAEIKELRQDLGSRIDGVHERIDRHLEGHA